jgi:hypothetical protein
LLHRKNIHLHLLAIADGSALPILRTIVRSTGGTFVTQFDPQKWADAVKTLMRAGAPKLLGGEPLPVHFVGELASLPTIQAMPWNRTWLKESATLLGEGTENDKRVAAVARWNVGEGRVMAAAFDPGPTTVARLAATVGGPPRDPRFRVTWETAARLRVTIDAVDGSHYINGAHLRLDLSTEAESTSATSSHDVPQIGPGQYELELPAPRAATFAAVRVEGHLIERVAVAGRYAPEFDAIGNDHEAMQRLSRRTGGEVIPPRRTWPIDFRWPVKRMALTSIFATLGALFVGAGLGCWKMTA